MNNLRVCICCGANYRYCSGCVEFAEQPKWRLSFDKEECKNLFGLFSDYANGRVDANEADEKIQNMNLTIDLNKIKPGLKRNLDDIKSKSTYNKKVETETFVPEKKKNNRRKNKSIVENIETTVQIEEVVPTPIDVELENNIISE